MYISDAKVRKNLKIKAYYELFLSEYFKKDSNPLVELETVPKIYSLFMLTCQSFIAVTLLNVQLLGRYGRYGFLLLKNRAMQGIIEELKVLNFSGLSRNCLNNNIEQLQAGLVIFV